MNLSERIKNYYEVLEVTFDCSYEQIQEGYLRAKNAYTGDSAALYSIMTKEECTEMIDLIETAYSVLSIPQKRKEYDKVKGISPSFTDRTIETSSGNYPKSKSFEQKKNSYPLKETGSHREFSVNSTNHFSDYAHSSDFKINNNEVEVSKIAATNRFRLDYMKNANFEQEIENSILYSGEFLKKIRTYKNVSVERMADLTKISRTYINCIEKDEYEKLPALAYTRGFVYQYAKILKIAADLAATSYINHIKGLQKKIRDTNKN